MIEIRTPDNFIYLDEPAVFGIKALDQGMIIRMLGELPSRGKHYIPGFSVLHEEEGKHIAKLNGSDDPAEFWKEHYIKPLGRGIAELFAMTGLAYDSPHSQNFLVELDNNFKPTGKIVFRDLGDSYAAQELLLFRSNSYLQTVHSAEVVTTFPKIIPSVENPAGAIT